MKQTLEFLSTKDNTSFREIANLKKSIEGGPGEPGIIGQSLYTCELANYDLQLSKYHQEFNAWKTKGLHSPNGNKFSQEEQWLHYQNNKERINKTIGTLAVYNNRLASKISEYKGSLANIYTRNSYLLDFNGEQRKKELYYNIAYNKPLGAVEIEKEINETISKYKIGTQDVKITRDDRNLGLCPKLTFCKCYTNGKYNTSTRLFFFFNLTIPILPPQKPVKQTARV